MAGGADGYCELEEDGSVDDWKKLLVVFGSSFRWREALQLSSKGS